MGEFISEEALKERPENKLLVESKEHMPPQNREDMIRILTVSADTELAKAYVFKRIMNGRIPK